MVNSGTFDTEPPSTTQQPSNTIEHHSPTCDLMVKESKDDEQQITTTSEQKETKIVSFQDENDEEERVSRLTNNDDDMEKASLCCSLPLDKVQDVLTTYQQKQQQENDIQIKQQQQTRKLLCLYCDRTFVSVNLREKHIERTHSIKQNKRRQSTRLQQHVALLKCHYCDKFSTNQHNDLFEHLIEQHSLQYFGCLKCGERFLNGLQLKDHNSLVHQTVDDAKKDVEEEEEVEEKMPVKVTRSRLRSKLEEEKKGRKVAVKGSRIAVKRSKRLQSKVPESQKQTTKRVTKKTERKQADNGEPANEKTTIMQQNQSHCINPYPEFDHFYRVKKITDHSIDNLKISSLTFDDVFDKAFFNRIRCNIQENLQHFIDGKLFKNIESETRILNFQIGQQMEQPTLENNFGCDLSLNALTPVPTQTPLTSQFGDDYFESQIEYGSKASKKKQEERPKEVNYKYFTRRKYQASIQEYKENRDLSKLDMWTQLVIKGRQQKIADTKKTPKEIQDYINGDEYKNKMQRDELNRILDRRGPFEDLKEEVSKRAAFDKLNSISGSNISEESFAVVREVLNDLLSRVHEMNEEIKSVEKSDVKQVHERVIPSYLNLRPTSSLPIDEIDKSDKIALICSSQETENFELPTNQVRHHDEMTELTGEWARTRMYICAACGAKLPNMKYLLDHKSIYHQNVWVQHYEFVGNQSELYRHLCIPGLGKVGAVELMQPTKLWRRSDARLCTKCNKSCNTLGELHRHVLECGGDWQWMMARKKCKYRPYGAKSRRKRRGLVKRVHNQQKTEPSEKKTYKKSFDGPRPRPSDAETIQRMLANLPAKRSTRKLISLQDGIYKSRKKQINNNPTMSNNQTKTKKMKCGKVIYCTNENQSTSSSSNTKQAQTSQKSVRNKVLSSRILDTHLALKRKMMNATRITRQTKLQATNEMTPNVEKESMEETKRKSVKRLVSGAVNLKSFFPVVRKRRGRVPNEQKATETATDEDSRMVLEKVNLVKDNEEDENQTKKRKITRNFRNVLKKFKNNVDDGMQEPKKFDFLEEKRQNDKIVTPSTTLEKNENIVQIDPDPQIVINDCKEDPPIPETIFNLESNNEANLQAKGELNFDQSDTNLVLKQCNVEETVLPLQNGLKITHLDMDEDVVSKKLLTNENELIVSPVMIEGPKSKPKVRKPSRGLNDCIAMLTSKLQAKEEEEKQKATVSKAPSPPPQRKTECILRIPSYKQHTFGGLEDKALDLTTKHYPLIVPHVEKKFVNVSESIKYPTYGSIDKIIEAVVENRLADVVKDKTWSSIDDTIQKVVDSCEITRKEVSIQTNAIEVVMGERRTVVYPRNSLDDVIDFVAHGGDVEIKLQETVLEIPKVKKSVVGKKVKRSKKKLVDNDDKSVIENKEKEVNVEIVVNESEARMLVETNVDNVLEGREMPVAPSSEGSDALVVEQEPEILENKLVDVNNKILMTNTVEDDEDDVPLAALISPIDNENEIKEKVVEKLGGEVKVVKRRGRPKKVQEKTLNLELNGDKSPTLEEDSELLGKRGRRKSKALKKSDDNDLFGDFSLVIKKAKTKKMLNDDLSTELVEKVDSVEEMDMELDETSVTAAIIETQIEESEPVVETVEKLDAIEVPEKEKLSNEELLPAEETEDVDQVKESPSTIKVDEVSPKTVKKRKRLRQTDDILPINNEIKENSIEIENSANCRRNRTAKSKALEHILDEALSELTESERNRDIVHEISEDKCGKKKRQKSNEIQSSELVNIVQSVIEEEKVAVNESEEDGLRRSRRSSRKITSYNENELAEPILELLDQAGRRKRKPKTDSEPDKQMNSDELFDLLKGTSGGAGTETNGKEMENCAENSLNKCGDLENVYEFTESSPESTLQSEMAKKRSKSSVKLDIDEQLDECSKKSLENIVEKANYCDICNKSFTRIENLNKHKRTLTHISKLSEIEAKEAEEAKAKQLEESSTTNLMQVPEDVVEKEPMENFIQQTDSLKLAEIISDVINKPETEEPEVEVRRMKSLGERKSFDSDHYESFTPEKQLETQINLLQNIIGNQTNFIEETTNLNMYNTTKEQDDESFLKPPTQFEEISEDSAQKLRKTLNRDEELFLECCSLLKSGSEVSSNSKKSNKMAILNTDDLNKCDDEPDCCWMERKSLTKVDLSDYSDNSRVLTPLGDSCADDASNSNTISSNWEQRQHEKSPFNANRSFTFEEVLQKSDIKRNVEEKTSWKESISKFGGILTKTLTSVGKKIANRRQVLDDGEKVAGDVSDGGSTCDSKKMLTKGALKVFEGLKVSIPTEELNLDQVLSVKKCELKTRKSKPIKNQSQFGSKLLFKLSKKCKSSDGKKGTEKIDDQHDVYDFEETQDNSDVFVKPIEFRNNNRGKKFDESDDNETNQMNELNSGSSLSSTGSIKQTKQPQNNTLTKKKCMIMGRIFKNAVKSKIEEEIRDIPEIGTEELLENYIANCDRKLDANEPIKHKMSEQEMDMIFDKLLEDSKKHTKTNNELKRPKKKRKRQRAHSDSTDDEFNINKTIKKRTNKKVVDNSINLEAELKECIGVASRKSQRKCTSGKQNVLVEYWSSDESAFEALLEETNQQPIEHKKRPTKKVSKLQGDSSSNRRKRTAPNPLYHWSSSSDDEMQGMIEVKPIRDELDEEEEEEDEDRPVQHGWIVGDSPKKLVTMLAQAKGSKKIDADCVKEQQIRKKQANNNNNNNNAIS